MQGHARHRAQSWVVMSHNAPVSLRLHGGEETLRLEAKEEGEETQAKEDRPVLPESLRQQLTVAKQTRRRGDAEGVSARDLARGTTPLWCSLAAHQAAQHCAQQRALLQHQVRQRVPVAPLSSGN